MKKLFLFFVLISSSILAQTNVKVDLRNPNATLYTHLYFLQPDSYNITKAATTIKGLSNKEAYRKVKKIKEVLDGNGLKVNFENVPKNNSYLDTISSDGLAIDKPLHRFAPFPIRLPEIYVEKIDSQWYFSKETVEKIDAIYADTFPWEFSWMESKFPKVFELTLFGIFIWKIIGILLLILLCVIFYLITKPILIFVLKNLQKLLFRKSQLDSSKLLNELARPILFIIIIRFIKNVLPSFQLLDFNTYLVTGTGIIETVFWVFVVLKLMKLIISIYDDLTKDSHSKLEKQLAPIINKLLFGIIIFIGFLHILTIFGVNPATVLAGASIGGIAIAFAAQDSVKNLIGTVVIFLDKPFHLDDWIVIGNVEGAVEKVGFRSTKIRAADTTVFQIPNSIVSSVEINNKGLRTYRRYSTELGIRYDTPPKLIEAFVDGIREIIVEHPDTRSESFNVEFSGFGDSALLILVNVFFKHLDWGSEQSSKHRLHLAIVKLAATLGVDFAFPSSTLMIEQLPGKESLALKYNTDDKHIQESIEKVLETFKNRDHSKHKNASSLPG